MFENAIQNALDGVWANTIGRLTDMMPDWLIWLFSQPMAVWLALLIGMTAGYVLGRWGPLALAALGSVLIAVFTLGRKSKSAPAEHNKAPRPRPDPRAQKPRTLLERFLGKGGK